MERKACTITSSEIYQENVRMILSEESHYSSGKCTMETIRAGNEEPVFGQTCGGNEVVQTRFAVADIPGQSTGNGWQNGDINGSVSRLSKALVKTVGPNSLLKVMAGDELSATTQYYYQNPVVNQTGNNLTSNVINALIQAISGSSNTISVIKGSAGNISTNLNGTAPFINKTSPDAANPNGNNPKAYLSILFFDERFKFIEEGSTTLRVSQAGGSNASLTLPNIKAPKNGFAYVYVSNESDEMVYFDNLQVAHNRGRIIEENHYYAFGLKIAGISSTKLGDANEGLLKNQNLYNDKELIDEADLNWYDYGFRNYDAQIGRFPQLDPLTDDYPELTPFQYASNDPIANIDLDGLEGTVIIGGVSHGIVGPGGQFLNGISKATSIASIGVNGLKIGAALDGQKNLSSDIEKRLQVLQAKNGQSHSTPSTSYQESSSWKLFEKMVDDEINKSWVSQGSNKYVNSITGQIRYSPTAEEGLYPEAIFAIPMPKFGFVFKLLGRGGEAAAGTVSRIEAGSLKEFKSLVQQLSKPGSQLTKAELQQFEKLTEQFGGKLRYDLNPVKGKILQPHVQVEGLGTSVGSRHIWLAKGVK